MPDIPSIQWEDKFDSLWYRTTFHKCCKYPRQSLIPRFKGTWIGHFLMVGWHALSQGISCWRLISTYLANIWVAQNVDMVRLNVFLNTGCGRSLFIFNKLERKGLEAANAISILCASTFSPSSHTRVTSAKLALPLKVPNTVLTLFLKWFHCKHTSADPPMLKGSHVTAPLVSKVQSYHNISTNNQL